MNNINRTGYTQGTNTESNSYNIIPSNIITMANVKKPLTLIPIINGKPRYDMRKIANPGDPDIDFGEGVSGVLEIPYNQFGGLSNPTLWSNINGMGNAPNQINTAMNYNMNISGNDYMSNRDIKSIYENTNSYDYSNNPIDPQKLDPNKLKLGYLNNVQNDIQKQKADEVKEKQIQQNGKPFMGAINPYSGWNMANASVMLGASIEDGNALGIIGSAGKILTEGFRNGFSGAAAMRRFRDSQKEYMDKDAETRRREGEYWAGTYQDGGKVSKKSGLLLTGNFLEGNDDHPMANAEVERGEYLQTPDGNTMEMLGKRHSEGGELVSVPENTKVISDYLKIGGELSSYFKKNFNINVSAGSTFATVLDKYKKKIGLSDLLEEEADIMKKIVDQEEVEFESTRDLNLQVLSKKVNELQPEKQTLEKKFNEFVNIVYNKQEEQKPEETEGKYQDGGSIEQQNQLMASVQKYAEMNGQNPEDVIKQLQSLPPEEQQQALQQIMTATDDGANQQQADTSNIENLIQQYAQITGQDPNTIIENLQNLDDQQLQQALQEIVQVVQQNSARQNPQEEMIEGNTSNPQEENLEQMKVGGEVVPKYQTATNPKDGSGKITRIYDEGYLPTNLELGNLNYDPRLIPQGISSMESDPISGKIWNPLSQESLDWFIQNAESQASNTSNYKFNKDKFLKDVENAKTREDKLSVLNKYQGERQQSLWDITPQDVRGYIASGYAPTQTGAQNLLNTLTGKNKEKYVKLLKDQGVNIQGNKIMGGFYKVKDNYDENSPIYKFINEDLNENQKAYETYTSGLINDKFYDRRMENFRKMEFASIKERDDYAKKQGFKEFKNTDGSITWVDSKNRNNIITPVVYRDKEVSPEELKKYESEKRVSEKEGYKPMVNEVGVYERWVAKGEKPTEKPNPKEGNGINPYLAKEMNNGIDLPMAVPDQSNLPPIYIPTSMRQVSNVQANRVFVSPEENLKELSKQSNTASNVLVESNPYTSAAGLANLQAQQNNSINQAITQTTIANQQDERNVSNINEERIMKRDQTNLGLADKYEREQIVGLDNYYNSWINFIDNGNRQNVANWNLQNEQNMFNAVNPNYKIGAMGQIYQTEESPIFYNGREYISKQTGQKATDKEIADYWKVKNAYSAPKIPKVKKIGGMIISQNLLDLLKK